MDSSQDALPQEPSAIPPHQPRPKQVLQDGVGGSALDAWLDAVLKDRNNILMKCHQGAAKAEDAKQIVLRCLEKELCTDLSCLLECWDDLKDSLPGVPRFIIGDAVLQRKYDSVQATPEAHLGFWCKAFLVLVIAMVAPLTVAAMKDRDGIPEEVIGAHAIEVWGPQGVIYILETLVCSGLGPRIGWDMIEQRSKHIHFRDAMRSSMTNQAVIATLFLTVAWPMAQNGAPMEEGDNPEARFLCQWYEGFVLMATGQLLIAVMVCSFNVLYIEPLDEVASAKFVKDNFAYFGEPMALMMMALYNTIAATILWVFGAFGLGCGIVFTCLVAYTMLRVTVVYIYLGDWKNPYLDEREVAKRKSEAKLMVTSVGKAKA